MEASRTGIENNPQLVPRLRLDKETFSFVKDLKVGDKGDMKFNGIVKMHKAKEGDDEETKRIKFTNIDLSNTRTARLI